MKTAPVPMPVPSASRYVRPAKTLGVLSLGVLANLVALQLPAWASGETHVVMESRAVDLRIRTGLWGFCRRAIVDTGDMEQDTWSDCYVFHAAIGDHPLSVCEAYTRGYVYGIDDVRGVRVPTAESDYVHRIEDSPTSLDDTFLQRFIEKSCGETGMTTTVFAGIGCICACLALVSIVWTWWTRSREHKTPFAAGVLSLLEVAVVANVVTMVMWIQQSAELREEDGDGARGEIHLDSSLFLVVLSAALYMYSVHSVATSTPARGKAWLLRAV